MKFEEIKEELRSVLKGKTLDSILPPLVFVIAYQALNLLGAIIIAVSFALLLTMYRIIRNASVLYSLFGLMGIGIATLFVVVMGNVSDYFLPGIIGSVALVIVTSISLLIKRPLPMLLSHLTRGWTFSWFLRKDIYPAYFETGVLWLVFFTGRALFQIVFYLADNVGGLTLMTTIFGLPLTIGILIITYVYGIYRLKTLNGPGIEEYDQGAEPPFKGQTRGF